MNQSSSETHEHGVGHVVPLKLLFGILAALLFLTVLTVAITWVDLGPMNIVAAMGIAVIKASLVALYFMHLRFETRTLGLIAVTPLVLCVFLLLMLTPDLGAILRTSHTTAPPEASHH